MAQEKITVHSLPDLKNTSDDAIPVYLNSLGLKQSHFLSDVRLGLGYTAFAICAATFYWDYKLGFESTKLYTAIAVGIYTLLNGALTLWIWGVEKGTIYVGHSSTTGEKISVVSATKKHVPIYNLTIKTWASPTAVAKTVRIKESFTKWFDEQGHFVAKPFQEVIASNVSLVGKLDPKRVVEEKQVKKPVVEVDGRSMDEKWASLLAESGESTATATSPVKGTKKRAGKA